jgi:hypothetical protein
MKQDKSILDDRPLFMKIYIYICSQSPMSRHARSGLGERWNELLHILAIKLYEHLCPNILKAQVERFEWNCAKSTISSLPMTLIHWQPIITRNGMHGSFETRNKYSKIKLTGARIVRRELAKAPSTAMTVTSICGTIFIHSIYSFLFWSVYKYHFVKLSFASQVNKIVKDWGYCQ